VFNGDASFGKLASFMDDGATGPGAVFKGEVVSDAGAIFRGGVDFGTGEVSIAGKAEFTKSGAFGATEEGTRTNEIKIGQAAFNYGKYTGINNMILGNGKVLFNAAEEGKTVSIDMASGASLNYTETNLILSGESGKISNALVTLNSGGITLEAENGKLTFAEDDGKDFILESGGKRESGGESDGFILQSGSVTLGRGLLQGAVDTPAALKATGKIKFNIAYGDTFEIKNAALDISGGSDIESDIKKNSDSEIVFNGTPVDGTYSFIDLTENGHIYTTGGTASAGFIVAGINKADSSTLTIISGREGAGSLGFINYVGDSNRIKNWSEFSGLIEDISAEDGVASANSATSNEQGVIAVFATKGTDGED
jgi:hypothetical protein